MDEIRVMIAIPTLDYIPYKFVESLVGLTDHLHNKGIEHDVIFQGGTLVYMGREALCKKMLSGYYSHMLWLDADMTFGADILDKMLDDDLDFVTGVYRGRHGEHKYCLFEKLLPEKRFEALPNKIFEVAGCGFGCVLVKRKLLERVKDVHHTWFTPSSFFGEDVAFCDRVDKIGVKMWCDPDVKCGHIALKEV